MVLIQFVWIHSGGKSFSRVFFEILGLRVSCVVPFPGKESGVLSKFRCFRAKSRRSRAS